MRSNQHYKKVKRKLLSLQMLAVLAGWFVCIGTHASYGQRSPVILWQAPAAVPFGTPLSEVELNAIALSAAPLPVPLESSYNIVGITSRGAPFAGGFDGSSWAYSASSLKGSISWMGIPFPLGVPDQANALSGVTVPLPRGSFGRLLLLGDLVNNAMPPTVAFVVHYTDGSSTTVQQSLSDWVNPRNYAGESLVECLPDRNNANGTIDFNSVCVYGYDLAVDSAKTVLSLDLPRNRNVVMLSAVLLPPEVSGLLAYSPTAGAVPASGQISLQTSFTPADPASYLAATASVDLTILAPSPKVTPAIVWSTLPPIAAGTQLGPLQLDASAASPYRPVPVPLDSRYRVNALYRDAAIFYEKGFDGSSVAFSADQLGTSLHYAGATFLLGPPAVPDAVTSTTLPLPTGVYSALYLLGAAGKSAQLAQTFTIEYGDGTSTTAQLDMSSWLAPQHFPGETIVATTTGGNASTGNQVSGTFDVYGYQIALDPSRIVKDLVLPQNTDVIFLAMGLGKTGTYPAPGDFTYMPTAGTVPALGTNLLSVHFTPLDRRDFNDADGSTQLLVLAPLLTITADDAAKVYGTVNPIFAGSVQGALPSDVFTESFTTVANTLSSAGTYAIVPAVQGPALALYRTLIVPGILTIGRAGALPFLRLTPSTALQNDSVTLSSTVLSATLGTPTGVVHFFSGAISLGSSSLAGGGASFITANLPVGANSVTMLYDGDRNFLPAALSPGVAIAIAPRDFSFTASHGTTLTGTMGQSPALDLTVAPLHGTFAGNLSFTMSGAIPPLASFSFSPQAVSGSDGETAVVFTLHTRLLTGANSKPEGTALATLVGLILLPMTAMRRVRRQVQVAIAAALSLILMASLGGLTGCGSGYRDTLYPIVVTASDGTVQHSIPLTLHILASPQ